MNRFSKIAVLGTSEACKIKWAPNGNAIEEANASPYLLELLADGYTVHIVSTRPGMYPEGCDKCLFDLIPEDRFFTANPEMEAGDAHAEGLIDLWERVLTHFDIEIPAPYVGPYPMYGDGRSWMDLRDIAKHAGITF